MDIRGKSEIQERIFFIEIIEMTKKYIKIYQENLNIIAI